MNSNPKLLVDFCDFKAAKYAVEHWHYSGTMPAGKSVKLGVWENGQFVGAVVFSGGASVPFYTWAKKSLGLKRTEICELCRVALKEHQTPVTRILRFAIKKLRERCPGLRCLVSFADMDENHHGGIYQGGNWLYVGVSGAGTLNGFFINGKKRHYRSIKSVKNAARLDPNYRPYIQPGKHKYILPLDESVRTIVQPMVRPYPKPKRDRSTVSGATD